jgi:putative addiction module killer protein
LRTVVRNATIAEEEDLGKIVQPKRLIVYATGDAAEPFTEWIENLRDVIERKRIKARISRLAQGNFGDSEPVGEGVSELRFFFGPGYRVYFGEHESNLVVLLCGGDKISQVQDVKTAKAYWKDFLSDAKVPDVR